MWVVALWHIKVGEAVEEIASGWVNIGACAEEERVCESQGTNIMKVHLFAREDESARQRGHNGTCAKDLSIRFTTADAIETDGFTIDCCRLRTSSGVDGIRR